MRSLVLTLLLTLFATGAPCAEPFPTEGWWDVSTLQKVAANVSVVFRLERYRPPESISSPDGSPDRLTVLREHPDEAWLLTFYRAEISVNAAETVQLIRSSIPARIFGNRITLFTSLDPVSYQITTTPEGTQLQPLDNTLDYHFAWELSEGRKVMIRRATPEAIEQIKKQVLTFFP